MPQKNDPDKIRKKKTKIAFHPDKKKTQIAVEDKKGKWKFSDGKRASTWLVLFLFSFLLSGCYTGDYVEYKIHINCTNGAQKTFIDTFEKSKDVEKEIRLNAEDYEKNGCNVTVIRTAKKDPKAVEPISVDTVYQSKGFKGIGKVQSSDPIEFTNTTAPPPPPTREELDLMIKREKEWENTKVRIVNGMILIEGENELTRALRN